jgi:hypothetical protein
MSLMQNPNYIHMLLLNHEEQTYLLDVFIIC